MKKNEPCNWINFNNYGIYKIIIITTYIINYANNFKNHGKYNYANNDFLQLIKQMCIILCCQVSVFTEKNQTCFLSTEKS